MSFCRHVLGIILALLGAGISLAGPVGASGAQLRQRSAHWTVSDVTFTSKYPKGFESSVKASSSGGAVRRARLIFNTATQRPSQSLAIYARDGAWDAAAGVFTASWEPDTTQMLPPWSLLAYHWEFEDAAGNEFKTDPAQVEYADPTHAWARSESQDAIVYTLGLDSSVKDMVLDALAQQREKYLAVWGAPLPYRPRIVLFGDFNDWQAWRTVPDYSGGEIVGQTFDEWGVIVQVVYPVKSAATFHEMAYTTVPHETEHLYQGEFLAARNRDDVPGWFIEGDATFFEIEHYEDPLTNIQWMAATGALPRLLTSNPADAPRIDGPNPRLGYDIGFTFFLWLEQSSGGLAAHHQLMKLLAANVPFFDALEQVTGLTTDQIEHDWRVWLGAPALPPTLLPTWTPPAMPWIATPTPQPS